jgi:hypothetical protein
MMILEITTMSRLQKRMKKMRELANKQPMQANLEK